MLLKHKCMILTPSIVGNCLQPFESSALSVWRTTVMKWLHSCQRSAEQKGKQALPAWPGLVAFHCQTMSQNLFFTHKMEGQEILL